MCFGGEMYGEFFSAWRHMNRLCVFVGLCVHVYVYICMSRTRKRALSTNDITNTIVFTYNSLLQAK